MPTVRKVVRMATTGTQTPAPPAVAKEHAEQNLGPPKKRATQDLAADEPQPAEQEEVSAASAMQEAVK